jgi:hypothetical protein
MCTHLWIGACTIKQYGFVMFGFHNKLMCLSLSKSVEVTDTSKKTNLLRNLSFFRK